LKEKVFFGRLKSRKLSNLKLFFLNRFKKECTFDFNKKLKGNYILEIGFGLGDNILNLARNNPKNFYVGVDPYLNGFANVIYNCKIHNIKNIFLIDKPIQIILERFKKNFFSKVFVLFPDPWIKNQKKKRKLISFFFLKNLLPKVKKNGLLIIATDDENYYNEITKVINFFNIKNETLKLETSFNVPNYTTKYYKRALDSKKKVFFLNIEKIKNLD